MANTATTIIALAEKTTIHEEFIRNETERPVVAYNKFSTEIPVISLAGIKKTGGEWAEICRKIAAACEDWGIFQVVDHDIDPKLIANMTRLAREFFDLPVEEKLRFDMRGGKKGGFLVSSHLQVDSLQKRCQI